MKNKKINSRFDRLLRAMATQPEPSGKPPKGSQTSGEVRGAGYGDIRTRADKSASASSKPKRKSP